MPEKKAEEKQMIARVPAELHRKAKALAAEQGRTLTEVLEELVREWIKEHKEKEGET